MQSIPSTFSSSTFRRFRVFAMAFFLAGGLLRVNASAGPAEQLFQAAQKQYQSGDVNKAVSTLQQALASKSDYVDALVLLGSCYVELGEFDKAVDPYRRAAQASPNDRGILQGYQTALEGAGQQEPQVAVLRTLFFQNPTNEAMGGKYLSLLESVGPTRFSKEYAELLEKLRNAPNSDPTYGGKLGRFYISIGKYPQAANVYRDLLKDDPESVDSWTELAIALEGSGDRAGAKDAYEKAVLYSSNADEREALQNAMKSIGTGKNVPAPMAVTEYKPQPVAAAPAPTPVASAPAPTPVASAPAPQPKVDQAAQARAQAEADRKAALEAQQQAKAEAASLAKEEADRKAQEKAEAQARIDADKKAALEAQQQAKAEAARYAKEEADRKAKEKADEQARIDADKKAALEAQRQAQAEAARYAKEEADRRAQEKAEEQARIEADKKAALEAQRQAQEEAARYAKEEADRKAKERADSVAQAEAMRKAKDDAERQFLVELDAVLTQKSMKLDTFALLTQIQDRRSQSRIPDMRLIEAEGILDYYQYNFTLANEQFRKLKVPTPLSTRLSALSFYELQDFPNAVKVFAKIPSIRENATDWGKYLRALVESGQRAQAATEYEAYLAKNPASEDALAYLIDYYRAPLQKEKLIPKLEMRLAKDPKDQNLITELIGLVDKTSPKAIEYRQRLLEITPDDNNTKLELAKLQEARGNRPEAIKLYQAVASDYSGDKAFNLKLADLLLQDQKKADAAKYLETAQNADPMDKGLSLRIAALYEELKQPAKAREFYLKAFDVDSRDKAVQAKLLEAYQSAGKDERRDVLMRIEGSDPTAHAAQFQLAKISLEDGDKDRAYDYISKAIKQQPQNPEYQALLPNAITNDYQVAEHLPLLEGMAQQPNATPELQMLVAKGLLSKLNNAGAAKYLALAYAKQPKLLEGNREAIISLNGAKQYPAVAALATQYASANPDDREIRVIQIEALTATGKGGEEMRQALRGLVQADPVAGSKNLLKLADLDLQAKDTAAAIEHAQGYLEGNAKAIEGWRFLYPLITGKAGQEELRIRTLEQLWTADIPNRPRYDRELADLYYQRESYDQSQKSLVRSVAVAPTDAALWYRLGEVETKQRNDASAAQRYAKAYQLKPDNADYARAYGQTLNSQADLKATLPLWKFLAQQKPTNEERRKFAQSLFLNDAFAESAKEWDILTKDDEELAKSEPMVAQSYIKSRQLAKGRKILESRLQSEGGNAPLLESVAMLYKQENNEDGYVKTLESLVQLDPKYKGYMLVLAQEKEKNKDFKGALDLYEQWVGQTPGDVAAIKSMHKLAGDQKDTARLMDALVRLNRIKGEDIAYRYQMVEIDFLRGGNITEVEALVRLHPEWKHGKEILVREYLKQDQKAKLAPYIGFLETESQTDKNLLEPLGDVYAMQKRTPQGPSPSIKANAAYWGWLQANPKNRTAFDKVYGYGKSTNSPNLKDILKLGAQSFPEDGDLQRQYAASLGNTPEAIAVYQAILSKDPDTTTLSKAVNVALALHQFEPAMKWLDKWSELAPQNIKVWETILSVAKETGNKPKQIDALNKMTALDPNSKSTLQALGQAYEEQGKPDKAADAYTRLLALDPKNKDVFHKLKTLLTGKNNQSAFKAVLLTVDSADATSHEAQFDLAKIYLSEGDKDKAYGYDTKALKLQPQNPEYQALLPLTITKDEQVQQNLVLLDKLALMPDAKPELQNMVAHGYLVKKNNPQAARFLMMVYAKTPKVLETDKDAILSLNAEKQYPPVATLAPKFLAANATDKEVRAAQVEAYLALGKSGTELREALKGLSDNYHEASVKHLLKLSELDLQAKDTAAALAHSKEYADANAKSLDGWRFVYPLAKDRKGEEEAYRKSLEALSALDTAQRTRFDRELVGVYFQNEKYDDARNVLQRELKKNPRDADFLFRSAEVASKQQKDSLAAAHYAKAYEVEPGNAVYARSFGKTVKAPEAVKNNLSLWKFLATRQPTQDEKLKLAQSEFMNADYVGASREWDGLLTGNDNLRSDPMVYQSYLRANQFPKAKPLMEAKLPTDSTNMELLEDLLTLYKAQNNTAGYLNTLERIVAIDSKRKDYQLQLAREREKAKNKVGALEQYDLWVSRTGGDLTTLESMHHLADELKDTVKLVEALVRLNRDKNADLKYKFQMASVDYARGGSILPIEKLVKQYPTYTEGRVMLVREYLKKREAAKLVPYMPVLDQLASEDRSVSEPAGDVYAQLKQTDKANEAYFAAYNANKKDKVLFDKVYDYAKKTNSTYRAGLLRQGYDTFTDDMNLKFDFAEAQGRSPRALEIYNKILADDPNQLPALRNAAEIAAGLGRTDTAVILLRRWTQLESQNVKPWTMLADIYQRGHKDAELAEAQGKIAELTPKDAKAAYTASQAYRKIKDSQRALEFLNAAVALAPQDANYQKEQALLMVELGQADKAKASLLQLDKKFPNDESINKALFDVYMASNDKNAARDRARILYAIKPYSKAYAISLGRLEGELNNPPEVARVLSQPTLRDTMGAELSFMLLDAYFKTNQKDRAAVLGPQLMQKYPDEAKKSLPLAVLFYDTRNRAKSKEILEAYTQTHDTSAQAYYYLGKIRYEEKNWSGAAEALEKAKGYQPDVAGMLGDAYAQSGGGAKAAAAYEDAYNKSKDPKILDQLYKIYKQGGDTTGGLQRTLERLLAVNPNNMDYRAELASIYFAQGDSKRAEEQLQQILKINPSHPMANYKLGVILAKKQDWVHAAPLLEIGTARYPDSVSGWLYLGDAYRATKRSQQAVIAYKRVQKISPDNLPAAVGRMQAARELNMTADVTEAAAAVIRIDPDNAEAAEVLAAIRFKDRKFAEAAPLYAKVVAAHPDDKEAWTNYGQSLVELKKTSEAKTALQKAVDLGASDPHVTTALARIYQQEGNSDKAEGLMQDMLKKDPKNHWAYFGLGQIAADRNQPGVAEQNYRKALQMAPGTAEYAEALARLLYAKDEFSKAIATLEGAKATLTVKGRLLYGQCLAKEGKADLAMTQVKAVYEKEPSSEVLATLADLYLAQGKTKEALAMLDTADKNDNSVKFVLAKARIANNEPSQARPFLDQLINQDNQNAEYYFQRGLCWYQERNWSNAQDDFASSLKYNADQMDAVYYTGVSLLKQGKSEEAQNSFKELSQNANKSIAAKGLYGMAMAFDADRKLEAVENYANKSIAAKENPEALTLLGRTYLRQRKAPQAEKPLKRALELSPRDPSVIAAVSEMEMAQGRKTDAVGRITKALQDFPNSCDVQLGAAKINFLAGNFDKSWEGGLQAIGNCPDDPGGYFFLGLTSDHKGNKKEAKRFFGEFVKHGGDSANVPEEYR